MAVKYFRLMATDGCPSFEPTGHFNGSWYGVARVENEAEISRLVARGCKEITEEQYQAELKKKAGLQASLDDFRLVTVDVRPAANPQQASTPKPPPPQELKIEQVAKPAAIPPRRSRSVQVPS